MLLVIVCSISVWRWGCFVSSFLRPAPFLRIRLFSVWVRLVVFCCCCSFFAFVSVFGEIFVIWWMIVAPPYPYVFASVAAYCLFCFSFSWDFMLSHSVRISSFFI